MINAIKQSDIFKNFYYILGLALQKGLPYLIIPLIVWRFGVNTYADFVVIYSLIQMIGLLIAIGTPNAFIVFWHNAENKSLYTASSVLIVLLISLILTIPAAIFIHQFLHESLLLLTLMITYAISINLNTLGLNLLRSVFRSKEYFTCIAITAFLQCLLIIFLPLTAHKLALLILINLSILILQTLFFFKNAGIKLTARIHLRDTLQLAKTVLGYSSTFTLYSILSLSLFTVDKWLIKSFFSAEMLAEYVLNFQFAFIVNIISIVVGMYSLPIFCRLRANHAMQALQIKQQQNYGLVIVFSIASACFAYSYAAITHLHLTYGFWLLVVAFLFTNLFTVNVSVLEAFKKVKLLFLITLIPTIIFWLWFGISAHLHLITNIYLSYIAYYIVIFALSLIAIKRLLSAATGETTLETR